MNIRHLLNRLINGKPIDYSHEPAEWFEGLDAFGVRDLHNPYDFTARRVAWQDWERGYAHGMVRQVYGD